MAKWVSSKIEFVENHSELKNRNERAREKYVHNNVVQRNEILVINNVEMEVLM